MQYLSKKEKRVITAFVKEIKDKLGDEIIIIRLFGSKVRGDFKDDSDIDIFVLLKEKDLEISDKIDSITADYIFNYNLPLSPVIYDLFEYRKNKKLGSFFFENVEKEGIIL